MTPPVPPPTAPPPQAHARPPAAPNPRPPAPFAAVPEPPRGRTPARRAGAGHGHGHGQPPMIMGQSWRYAPRPTHDQAMTTSVRFDRLETERLIMRRWQEAHRAPVAGLNPDPNTLRVLPDAQDRAAPEARVGGVEARSGRH